MSPKRTPPGVNRALEQGGEALGVLADMFMPGLRDRLSGAPAPATRAAPGSEVIEPEETDVVVDANACGMCEGAGELVNIRGRHVTCLRCDGRGTR